MSEDQFNNSNPLDHSGNLIQRQEPEPDSVPIGLADDNFDDFAGDPALDAAMDPYAASSSGAKGILIFALLIILAGAVLWTMRKTGGVLKPDSASAANEAKIDMALKQFQQGSTSAENKAKLNALFADTDQVVTIFGQNPSDKQVTLDNVQMNPFMLHALRGNQTKAEVDQAHAVTSEEKARAEKMKNLQEKVSMLSLQSVLIGKDKLAVISGKILKKGQKIDIFEVTSIDRDLVEITSEGFTFALKIQKPSDQK